MEGHEKTLKKSLDGRSFASRSCGSFHYMVSSQP